MKKSFKNFVETKDKGLADNNGLIPNQEIPKAGKKPETDLANSLAGRDYKGQLGTQPVQDADEPFSYKDKDAFDKEKKGVLVRDDDDEEGLAYKDNGVITQKTSSLGEKPDTLIQKVKAQKKMTSEQFIDKTSKMTSAEFVDFFLEHESEPLPTITDLYGNEFTPDPNQTVQYMASLMVKNPRLLERLVREMKRYDGGMNMLLSENFNHPEFYTGLVNGMVDPEEGKKRCHRISKSMNEQYMNELNKFMFEQKNEEVQPKEDLAFEDGGPMGNPPQNPSGMMPKRPQGGAFGGGGVNGPAPKPMPGLFGSGPQVNPPRPGGMFGGSATASNGPPGFDMGNGGVPNQPKPFPKMNGDTAHGNMVEGMGNFPHILSHMTDYCIHCKK